MKLTKLFLLIGAIFILPRFGYAADNEAATQELSAATETLVVSGTQNPAAEQPPLAKVYFGVGKTTLPKDASKTVAPLVEYLKANAGSKVYISGYHDPTGSAAKNEELAKNRAIAVKNLLVKQGVSEDQVVLKKPRVTTGTGNLAEARRVEVNLIDDEAPAVVAAPVVAPPPAPAPAPAPAVAPPPAPAPAPEPAPAPAAKPVAVTQSGPLPAGRFGVGVELQSRGGIGGATYSTTSILAPRAQLLYTISNRLQLDFGVGVNSLDIDDVLNDPVTSYGVNIGGKYFFGQVPYLGVSLGYEAFDIKDADGTPTIFLINAVLGGQAFVMKNQLALYGQVGVGYQSLSGDDILPDVSNFGVVTGFGASFYFGGE